MIAKMAKIWIHDLLNTEQECQIQIWHSETFMRSSQYCIFKPSEIQAQQSLKIIRWEKLGVGS
jgi:hypothetical protein